MKPKKLTDAEILTLRREQHGVIEQLRVLEAAKTNLIAAGPDSVGPNFDRKLEEITASIIDAQTEVFVFNQHIEQAQAQTSRKTGEWRLVGNIKTGLFVAADANRPPNPPQIAEALSRIVTKPKLVERVLGSRSERFALHVKSRGLRTAQLFYWADTFASIWPAVKQLFRWAIVGDFIRRLLGS